MTITRWEYAQIFCTRDPGSSDPNMDAKAFHAGPGATEYTEIEGANVFNELNRLGGEGWEVIGPPIDFSSVFTYKAANDTWHDRAYWVERTWWLKRPVES